MPPDFNNKPPVLAIVDDEQSVVQFLGLLFRRSGFIVHSFTDSSLFMEWLEENRCDTLILDWHMPNIDGFTLLCMIHQRDPKLPVIVFSGLFFDEEEQSAIRDAGAFDYMCKGSSAADTIDLVKRAVAYGQMEANEDSVVRSENVG